MKSDKVKIWLLHSNRWNSAITEYALSTAHALVMSGHDVVLTPLLNSPAHQRAVQGNLQCRPLEGFGLSRLPGLYRIFDQVRPNVLITFGGAESTLTAAFSVQQKIRFRGQDLSGLLSAWRANLSDRKFSQVVTPSLYLSARLRQAGAKGPFREIILGCDTEKYYRPDAVRLPERPVLMVFGRLDPVKGHKNLFEIFAHARRQGFFGPLDPVIRVLGQPANLQVSDLARTATECGLRPDDDIGFDTRRIDAIAPELAAVTLGVVPSLGSEIICRVAQEFLLCGTPVIVSGVGSLGEYVLDSGCGNYLGMSLEDAARLLGQLTVSAFRESPAERELRANAAKNQFSLARMAQDWDAILHR